MYIRRHVPSPSPPTDSTTCPLHPPRYTVPSVRPFPGFACTRGQINVDGTPRAPFFCRTFFLPLSLSPSLSRIVLATGSICPYLSVCPRDFFSDSQCIILIDYSLRRWFIFPRVLWRRNRENVYRRRRHFAIEPSRFRAAIEPIFYASFPLCHEHFVRKSLYSAYVKRKK